MKEYAAFGADAGDAVTGGAALFPTATATTVRVSGGKSGDVLTTDGPFAGPALLRPRLCDEAIRLAREPGLSPSGSGTGPATGLAELDAVVGLERLHLWHACRGALLERLGRHEEAARAYVRALQEAPSPEEAAFLRERLAMSDQRARGRAGGPDERRAG